MWEEIREIAGADAAPVERAAGCRQHRQILIQNGGEVKTDPFTGQTYIEMPPRRRPEIQPQYPVQGLKVFFYDSELRFEFVSTDCLTDAECIDAQCRAGWNDDDYGFSGADVVTLVDGSHRARWSCGTSCRE